MVEPLTAFAAAGNILQFIELGIKVLRGATEIYNAKDGLSEKHSNLHSVVKVCGKLFIQRYVSRLYLA